MTPPADDQTPRWLARWALNAPIVAWWVTLLLLVVLLSPLAIAWFVSGLLMLVNVVAADAADAAAEETDHG